MGAAGNIMTERRQLAFLWAFVGAGLALAGFVLTPIYVQLGSIEAPSGPTHGAGALVLFKRNPLDPKGFLETLENWSETDESSDVTDMLRRFMLVDLLVFVPAFYGGIGLLQRQAGLGRRAVWLVVGAAAMDCLETGISLAAVTDLSAGSQTIRAIQVCTDLKWALLLLALLSFLRLLPVSVSFRLRRLRLRSARKIR